MALPLFTEDEKFTEDRKANDQRLKARFEHIFSKYERDFEGIGDEIDLATGKIVVNNGHIASLSYLDIGSKAASTFIDSFAHEHAEDTPDDSLEAEEDEEPDDDEDSIDELVGDHEQNLEIRQSLHNLNKDEDNLSDSSEYTSSGILTDDGAGDRSPTPDRARASSQAPGSQAKVLKNISGVIRNSLMAMKSKDGPFDKASLDKFESNIAGEIARFLATTQPDTYEQEPEPANDPIWSFPELPRRKRQRSESPAGLTSRPALSSSAALFTKSPRGSKLYSSQSNKRFRSSSPSDDELNDAQAKFMSVVRAHSQYPGSPPASVNIANSGRRILPKPMGGPSLEQQQQAEHYRQFISYAPSGQQWQPWSSGRRLQWEDDVPSFRPQLRPLAPKNMLPAPVIQPRKPTFNNPEITHAGPTSNSAAMRELQFRHVRKLDSKQYRNPHLIYEEPPKDAPRPLYTPEEDALILKLRYDQDMEWEDIMMRMPERDRVSLYNRFSYIRRVILPDFMQQPNEPLWSTRKAIMQLTQFGPMPPRAEWLRSLFSKGASGKTLLEEADMDNMPKPDFIDDARREGGFSEKEDRLLARLRDKEQMLFEEMETHFSGRTAQDLADRYYEHIMPKGPPKPRNVVSMLRNNAVARQRREALGDDALDDGYEASYEAPPLLDHAGRRLDLLNGRVLRPAPPVKRPVAVEAPTPESQPRPAPQKTSLPVQRSQAPRPIPQPSRFSGIGRNPFARLVAETSARLALSSGAPAVRPSVPAQQVQRPVAARFVNRASQSEMPGMLHAQRRPPANVHAQHTARSLPARPHATFAERGISEVPNSTAQSEWTSLSQSSNTNNRLRLLQQRPLRRSAQRRSLLGELPQAKANEQGTRDSSTSSKHDSFFDTGPDAPDPLCEGIHIEYGSSPMPFDYGHVEHFSINESSDSLPGEEDSLSDSPEPPPPRLPTPKPPTPPPQEQLLHLTKDLFKNHTKHVARRRKDVVWHSSDDDDDASDYAPERADVLEYEAMKDAADEQIEAAKYEKSLAVAKALHERAAQRLALTSDKPAKRKSLPAKLDRWSSEPSASSAPPSPDKLLADMRDLRNKALAKALTVKRVPEVVDLRSPSPDMLQESRRTSMPAKLVKESPAPRAMAVAASAVPSKLPTATAMDTPPVQTAQPAPLRSAAPQVSVAVKPKVAIVIDLSEDELA